MVPVVEPVWDEPALPALWPAPPALWPAPPAALPLPPAVCATVMLADKTVVASTASNLLFMVVLAYSDGISRAGVAYVEDHNHDFACRREMTRVTIPTPPSGLSSKRKHAPPRKSGGCLMSARRALVLSLSLLFLASVAGTAFAQNGQDRLFTFNVGGGITPVVGELRDRLDFGGHVLAGAGMNLGNSFSINAEYMFNGLGIDRAVLNQVQAPDGSVRMHSITLNPRIRFAGGGPVSPYVIGGIGWYRRTVEFTEPVLITTTFFDPWWGFVEVPTVADQVIASFTRDAFGGNLGLGVDFRLGGAKLYTEARYHHANTARRSTQILPVTLGIRF